VNPLRTLRGRLAGAMMAIFLLALGTSALLDTDGRPSARNLLPEPYQDALVLGCFSAAAFVLIWVISSWSLKPLALVSEEARGVGPLAPAARLSRAGLPAEITPLVDAVNGALDRMTDAFAAERRFTENAAHELRTPLAVLGLRLQRARQGEGPMDWPAVEQDLAHMNRLVGQLLHLARQENAARTQAPGALPEINLSRIAREAAAMVLPLAEANGRALDVDVPDTLLIHGQAYDLREALCSLLENAALHGKGTITLSATKTATETILTVRDEGEGVPQAQAEHMFERFQKGPHSQGTGLGLAIVREIARVHAGTARFVPGPRCAVEMRLSA
jgi:two-component system sensor histidine kinase QseC